MAAAVGSLMIMRTLRPAIAGVLGSGALRIVEIGRDGNDSLGDGGSK